VSHDKHFEEPLTSLYKPGAQAVQVHDSVTGVKPWLHVQLTRILPAGEKVWFGHWLHSAAAPAEYKPPAQMWHTVAPANSWYQPASHCMHGNEPFTFLYVPGAQAEQAEPSVFTRCNRLQQTATDCNRLQQTWCAGRAGGAISIHTLQHAATSCNKLQHTAA